MPNIDPAENKLEDPPWVKTSLSKRVVYIIPRMTDVKVQKNLIYKRSAEKVLSADIYIPPTLFKDERRPGVLFIHGGYLPPNLRTQPKDWGIFTSYGQLMAASGLIGITFNHRYYSRDHLKTAQMDILDLIAFVRDQADQYHLDKDRLNLWAFSGGGPLISWALRSPPSYLRALVLYYTILELNVRPEEKATPMPVEKLDEFSPVVQLQHMGKNILPIFIARAGLDRPALNASIDKFVETAISKNLNLDLCNHAQGQHGFDILDDQERSRQIIQRTIDYIRIRNS
jgi:acetyl esterase/lipase